MTGTPPDPAASASEHRMRVRYVETDQQGVAHHSNYLAWFEEGRTEWLRRRGMTYRDMEASGAALAITEVRIRYLKPTHYDDLLVVRTRLSDRRRASLRFHYEIRRDGEAELVCEGETELACVDRQGRLRRLPDGLPF